MIFKHEIQILKKIFFIIINKKNKKVSNRIYFYNIWGQYSDNTKALAEAFHEVDSTYELIYEVSDTANRTEIPDYIHLVKAKSNEANYYKATARVVIDNDWGAIKKSCKGVRSRFFGMLKKAEISKNTFYVSTGHGTPIKKIGCDAIGNDYDSFITSTNIMFVSDNHSADIYERITLKKIKNIQVIGSPRNDILYSDFRVISKAKEKLNITGKKVILFAPTFRTKIENGKVIFEGAKKYIDDLVIVAPQLVKILADKFNGKWIIGIRVHPGVTRSVSIEENKFIFNANRYDDMSEYLMIADILVTDYSSCAIDFLLTSRPCFLLWLDYQEYLNSERGLYFSENQLPFPVVRNVLQLFNTINSYDHGVYLKKKNKFENNIGLVKTGPVSYNIVNIIKEMI